MTYTLLFPVADGSSTRPSSMEVTPQITAAETGTQIDLFLNQSSVLVVSFVLDVQREEVRLDNWTELLYQALAPGHFEDSENAEVVRLVSLKPAVEVVTCLGMVDFKFTANDQSFYLPTTLRARKVENPIIVTGYHNLRHYNLAVQDTSLSVSLLHDGLLVRYCDQRGRGVEEVSTYHLPIAWASLNDTNRMEIYTDPGKWFASKSWSKDTFSTSSSNAIHAVSLGEFSYIRTTDDKVAFVLVGKPLEKLVRHVHRRIAFFQVENMPPESSLRRELRLETEQKLNRILAYHAVHGESSNPATPIRHILELLRIYDSICVGLNYFDHTAPDHFAPSHY